VTEGKGGSWHNLSWGSIAFGATLALVIGLRLDRAALTVIVGVACGILASIPTGLFVVALLKRRNEQQEKRKQTRGTNPSPPVVVIAPPMLSAGQTQNNWAGQLALPDQRRYAVIGDEMTEEI